MHKYAEFVHWCLHKLHARKVTQRYADFFTSNQHFCTYNYTISYLNFPLVEFSKFPSRFIGTYKQISKESDTIKNHTEYKTNL